MAITPGTEAIIAAAARWRDRCLLRDGSVLSDGEVWTSAHVSEIEEYFVKKPDEGDRRFMEKFRDQLEPVSPGAKRLAAEMLWVMLLFPNNITPATKIDIVSTIWDWSGEPLPRDNPELLVFSSGGIGSGGMGFNNYRPHELTFFVRLMKRWKALTNEERTRHLADPWEFAGFVDATEGADRRQLRHMLLHLLFPDAFERISSGDNKRRIDAAFRAELDSAEVPTVEQATTLVARDRRLLHVRQILEAAGPGKVMDFYRGEWATRWRDDGDEAPAGEGPAPQAPLEGKSEEEPAPPGYVAPDLDSVTESIRSLDLRIDARTVRRYHLALASRGFVILSGVSGTGKTWLAEAYADAIGAQYIIVPVAPNWTTNEDLLGYVDPFSGNYRDTPFSRFLRRAAHAYGAAIEAGLQPAPYHLILDEMNLARVEYYFARFLSAMEQRMREGEAKIELGANDAVVLPPNLYFVGTVNVDETTHGFADKVYDRAQLIEMPLSRSALEQHLGGAPYRDVLLSIWDAVHGVAPFAFRVLDDIGRYIDMAGSLGVPWQDSMDELILQKVLPKVRGADPRVGGAIQRLVALTDDGFPLSNAKARDMQSAFEQSGVASFF